MAFGHVAWHRREEAWTDTLLALNGFNGTMLWRRPLTSGIMVDRSTMIATPDSLYLADERSCKLLDAATGQVRGEIAPPAALAGGTFWKWMALEGDVLYALVGQDEFRDAKAQWRRTEHGWPWDGISKGYNDPHYRWGFGQTLLAIDLATKKVLWHHAESPAIDSRSLCMAGGRLFFCSFGRIWPAWTRPAAAKSGAAPPTKTPTFSRPSAPIAPTTTGSTAGRARLTPSVRRRPCTCSARRCAGSPP